MRRWNGWGDDAIHMKLPATGLRLLRESIGKGQIQKDFPLGQFLERIPVSQMPRHPLISFDQTLRLNHSHGQSLPDWIGLRGGILERFPDGVAQPTTLEAVEELLRFAVKNDIIVIPFGGGTSVVGHLDVPFSEKPVLSLSLERLTRMIKLDADNLLATFEAGIRGPDLEAQLNSYGFTLGHFPQSFEYSSLGGWVVTRSTGQQSKHYGRIEQLFAGGEVLTPQGTLFLPPFPASAAGPDLRQLVLGSEGRMGILTKVIVRISRLPQKDDFLAFFFPSWDSGQTAVQALACSDIPVSMVRLSNPIETITSLALAGHERAIGLLNRYLGLRRIPQETRCLCLVGLTGSRSLVNAARRAAFSLLRKQGGVLVGKAIGKAWEKNRFRSAYLRNTLWDLGYAVDTLETAVTWDKVTSTMDAIETALKMCSSRWNDRIHVFSHLSHIYPTGSSIYTTFVFRLAETPQVTLDRWRSFKQTVSRTIVDAGGTISHQHGVGIDHKPYLSAEKGTIGINALKKTFKYLDPEQHMNPTKLLP